MLSSLWWTDCTVGLSLTVFLLASTADVVGSFSGKCVKTTPCSCRFPAGKTIDLSRIETPTPVPKFNAVRGLQDGNIYYYNPCADFRMQSAGANCTSAAICVYYTQTRSYNDLGSARAAEFETDEEGRVTIVYKRVAQKAILTTKIHLICSRSERSEAKLSPWGSTNNHTEYNMTLTSKCACPDGCTGPRGLSVGSVLLIVLAVGVVVYLGVGIAYNRSLGARGLYTIPQYTFWADLPSLVKDGYWFFLSPCIGDRVEYRHYERL